MRKKLNFIVVGAPKCGTTSLHHYLKQNPKIFLTEQKELHFFSAEMRLSNIGGPGDKEALASVVQTTEEYDAHFAECRAWQIAGDISPSYFHFGKMCAKKIHKWVPNVKIIVILRNPIEKTYSQYMHQVQHGMEILGFRQALAKESNRQNLGWRDMWMYTGSTFYTQNLQDYIDVFGAENVHVIFFEDFVNYTKQVLDDICYFIGVEPCEWDVSLRLNKSRAPISRLFQRFIMKPPTFINNPIRLIFGKKCVSKVRKLLQEYNTKQKPEIKTEVREQLRILFTEDVRELENLLGYRVPWNEFRRK